MSYPTTRRFFRDDEFRNENAAIAGLARGLALWENYTWARDLVVTPADPKVYGQLGWPWALSSFELKPNSNLGPTSVVLARFPVLEPKAPCTSVRVAALVTGGTIATYAAGVTVTNLATGDSATIPFSGAISIPANTWWDVSIRASVGDTLQITAWQTAGPPLAVGAITAWWNPASLALPGATFTSGFLPISQAFHSTNVTLATYALRQLGRSANAFVADRPQMIAATWLSNPAAGTGGGYSTVPLVVGRYMLPIGGRVSSLTVRLRYRASGACSVTCALSGGGSSSVAIAAAGYGWVEGTISRTPGALAYEELTLTVAGSPSFCDIEHVLVYEDTSTAAGLGLPGAETVPGNFDPNLDERLMSGRGIREDDVDRLVANMVYLWSHRRNRVLVNDCRFSYKELETWSFTGIQGVADKAALHAIPLVNMGSGFSFFEVQVRAGWNACALSPPSDQVLLQVGAWGSSDHLGSPAVGEPANANATVHGQATWQHRWGATPGAPQVVEFGTHLVMPGSNKLKSTRPSWLVLEQLPLGAPAATYP